MKDCGQSDSTIKSWIAGIGIAALFGMGLSVLCDTGQRAIAQATSSEARVNESISFVATAGEDPTIRDIPGYTPRFNDVVGSGVLLLNADEAVVGYYFILSGLEPGTNYAYHFHSAVNEGRPTSCEGDKNLVEGEAAGTVITNLTELAPIDVSASGIARVGSIDQPVQLSEPVPLSEIGYLNIHPASQDEVGPGVVCANVRLNPGGFER